MRVQKFMYQNSMKSKTGTKKKMKNKNFGSTL